MEAPWRALQLTPKVYLLLVLLPADLLMIIFFLIVHAKSHCLFCIPTIKTKQNQGCLVIFLM